VSGSMSRASEHMHERVAETLATSLGEMKGMPMKLGQMLSYIDELMPAKHREAYREGLAKLQAQTPAMDWSSIEGLLERNLGAPPDEFFAEIDHEPIAAASIGQVYRARLHNGDSVAVKVQYPGIAESVASDLDNAKLLAAPMFAMVPRVAMEGAISDLRSRLQLECDYALEAQSQLTFADLWAGDDEIYVPRVYQEMCGPQVLVTEFIEGESWAQMMARTDAADRARYGRILFRFVYHSLYAFGIFNTDPHPGNYLFMPDGRVAFLDFGSVHRYEDSTRRDFCELALLCMHKQRGPEMRRVIHRTFGIPEHVKPDEELWQLFETFCIACAEPWAAPQPYKFKPELLADISANTSKARSMLLKRILRDGLWTPERSGIAFMYRINFGLNSLLCELGPETDWREIINAACAKEQ
ncbi:MAG TPA: hypothetical protein DIU15_19025, partial [Deltaproteobacteria bacterium]|nr:hypothetical protein [Deltaproteobacteria bacterium]